MTSSDIAAAVARSIPSATDIATAIIGALVTGLGATTITGATAGTPISTVPSNTGGIFNPVNLPTDVLARYKRKQQGKVFT
jgi:hypothetical protein